MEREGKVVGKLNSDVGSDVLLESLDMVLICDIVPGVGAAYD